MWELTKRISLRTSFVLYYLRWSRSRSFKPAPAPTKKYRLRPAPVPQPWWCQEVSYTLSGDKCVKTWPCSQEFFETKKVAPLIVPPMEKFLDAHLPEQSSRLVRWFEMADKRRPTRKGSGMVRMYFYFYAVLWIQIHWIWIRIQDFGPIWIRIQIQGYTFKLKRKN